MAVAIRLYDSRDQTVHQTPMYQYATWGEVEDLISDLRVQYPNAVGAVVDLAF